MTAGHDLTSIWQIFRQTHIIHQVVEVGKKRKKEHYFFRNFTWVKKKKYQTKKKHLFGLCYKTFLRSYMHEQRYGSPKSVELLSSGQIPFI